MEALHVVAMAVDLIGLDQVHEHQAGVELAQQRGGGGDALGVGGPVVLLVHAHAGEQVADLAHGVHRHAVVLELLEVGAPGRRRRVVAPALAALERARLALEGAGDHAPHLVLAVHQLARLLAHLVEAGLVEHVHVGGDLQHRVGRRVEDQLAGLEVMLAEVLDHLGAAVGAVAAEAPARGLLQAAPPPRAGSRPDRSAAGARAPRPSAPSARWSTPCPGPADASDRAARARPPGPRPRAAGSSPARAAPAPEARARPRPRPGGRACWRPRRPRTRRRRAGPPPRRRRGL